MALQWLIDEAFITDEGSLIELRKALLCEPDQLNGLIEWRIAKESYGNATDLSVHMPVLTPQSG